MRRTPVVSLWRLVVVLPFLTACGSTDAVTPPDEPDVPPDVTIGTLVPIPAGQFVMGDHHGLGGADHGNDEVPLHTVSIGAFQMSITEVTTREYVAFLTAAMAEGAIDVVGGMVVDHASGAPFCDTRQGVAYGYIFPSIPCLRA